MYTYVYDSTYTKWYSGAIHIHKLLFRVHTDNYYHPISMPFISIFIILVYIIFDNTSATKSAGRQVCSSERDK